MEKARKWALPSTVWREHDPAHTVVLADGNAIELCDFAKAVADNGSDKKIVRAAKDTHTRRAVFRPSGVVLRMGLIAYQEALRTPGISPLYASSRKQILQIPYFLRYA